MRGSIDLASSLLCIASFAITSSAHPSSPHRNQPRFDLHHHNKYDAIPELQPAAVQSSHVPLYIKNPHQRIYHDPDGAGPLPATLVRRDVDTVKTKWIVVTHTVVPVQETPDSTPVVKSTSGKSTLLFAAAVDHDVQKSKAGSTPTPLDIGNFQPATAKTTTLKSSSTSLASRPSKSASSSSSSHSSLRSSSPLGSYPSTTYPAGAAFATAIVVPSVKSVSLHGKSSTDPDMKYMPQYPPLALPNLPQSQLLPSINNAVSQDYEVNNATATLPISSSQLSQMLPLEYAPQMSRDGGKGGYLAGSKLFIFSDTATLDPSGSMVSFVCNSVASDKGLGPVHNQQLTLEDHSGEWANSAGAMRGFVPLTGGESAYNAAMNNNQRYAIWPESSLIPIDATSAYLYAPIIFVDSSTATTSYKYAGTTLSIVSIPDEGGPAANRIVPLLYPESTIEWGCLGGIRSWSSAGPGVAGGKIYIMGNAKGGVHLARVDASRAADVSAYEYWSKTGSWSKTMPSASSTDFFIEGAFSTLDIVYSPRHYTFLAIYQTPYADNKFHYRYLMADKALRPSFEGGDDADFVENLTKYPWSAEMNLYDAPAPTNGQFTYGGGSFAFYNDADDVQAGGDEMLLGWTYPVGNTYNPNSSNMQYEYWTAQVEWN